MKFNLPMRMRLFLSHFLVVLLVSGSVGTYFYYSAAESLKTSLQSRLRSSAALLSRILDPAELDSIREAADQTLPVYQEYLTLLRTFREANPDIAFMYVMRKEGDRVSFVIDSDQTEAQALPGREYLTAVPALLEGFSHPSVDDDIVTDEWGSTLSGYAPIPKGHGLYLIGIDMDATEVQNKFRSLRISGLISLVSGFILAVLLSRVLASRVIAPITLLISRCKAIAEGQLDEVIEYRNGDELDGLISAVNDMSKKLAESRERSRQAEEALKQANDELEGRIAERTKDLVEVNLKLMNEIEVRTKTVDALLASEERYRDLADLLPQTVFEADSIGNLTFLNRAGFEILGFPQEDFKKGLKLSEIFAGEVSRNIIQDSLQRTAREKVECIEHEARRKDGSTFPVCTYATPILSGERCGGLRGIIVDMSEHRRLEGELHAAQKFESISVLAAGIAHDFNNLLTTIMGTVSLAQALTKPEDRLNSLLARAEGASLQARDLAKQLTSLTRVSVPVKSSFVLGDAIKEAAHVALSGSSVSCSFHIADDLSPVFCDRAQIRQMVMNLVLNAKEAMPEGGSMEIDAVNVEEAALEIPSLEADNYVKLTIRDKGMGVPGEHLPRVFDPYFSTKERGVQKGMGLGLTIAYAIVKRHRGHISLRSSPGVGTEVDVYLPVSPGSHDQTFSDR
jgi:PAS domain S-box-containing protein